MTGIQRRGSTRIGSSASIWGSRVALHLAFAAVALLFLFPFYWMGVSAFKTQEDIFALPPALWPQPPVWHNFVELFATTPMLRAFVNSVAIAGANVVASLFLCSLAGFAFAKYPRAPGNKPLFLFVLATTMIPAAVTLIPLFVIMLRLGWINTYWAMIVPGAASAFGIFWMRQYISDHVADELLDAGRIDGCSEFGLYWRITLPIARPALAALAVMVLIGSWNNLMWAFVVLHTEDMYTMPLVIYLLQDELKTPFGMLMAAGVVATAPLVVAFLIFQRQFISGLAAGAVKA